MIAIFFRGARIEEDPVWAQVSSEEFEAKFMNHEIPAVVNYATLVKKAHLLAYERAELVKQLETFKEDKRNSSYLPGELYQFISQLRTRVDSLEALVGTLQGRVEELEAYKAGKEDEKVNRAKKGPKAVVAPTAPEVSVDIRKAEVGNNGEENGAKEDITNFAVFSDPNLTSWNQSTATLTYTGKDLYNYVILNSRLPSDRTFQWTVSIDKLPGRWIYLGIIGKLANIHHEPFFDSSAYGWGTKKSVYAAGVNTAGQGGWPGWQQGDRGMFTFSPAARTLSLRLERTNEEYFIGNLNVSVIDSAYIHCSVFRAGTTVRLSAVA